METDQMTKPKMAMLSTKDNPFNPFKEFDLWKKFDEQQNYFTCSYLARIARTSDDLSEEDETLAIQQAIDEIMDFDLLDKYIKVYED